MRRPRSPLFLERETYRRRRVMDAARVLPVLGLVLVLLPVLWTRGAAGATAGEAVYLFALWLVLIVAAFALSRPLYAAMGREGEPMPRRRTDDRDAGTAKAGDPRPAAAPQGGDPGP